MIITFLKLNLKKPLMINKNNLFLFKITIIKIKIFKLWIILKETQNQWRNINLTTIIKIIITIKIAIIKTI
jgi:hypothetical protein